LSLADLLQAQLPMRLATQLDAQVHLLKLEPLLGALTAASSASGHNTNQAVTPLPSVKFATGPPLARVTVEVQPNCAAKCFTSGAEAAAFVNAMVLAGTAEQLLGVPVVGASAQPAPAAEKKDGPLPTHVVVILVVCSLMAATLCALATITSGKRRASQRDTLVVTVQPAVAHGSATPSGAAKGTQPAPAPAPAPKKRHADLWQGWPLRLPTSTSKVMPVDTRQECDETPDEGLPTYEMSASEYSSQVSSPPPVPSPNTSHAMPATLPNSPLAVLAEHLRGVLSDSLFSANLLCTSGGRHFPSFCLRRHSGLTLCPAGWQMQGSRRQWGIMPLPAMSMSSFPTPPRRMGCRCPRWGSRRGSLRQRDETRSWQPHRQHMSKWWRVCMRLA
jgi:hypothetical protein